MNTEHTEGREWEQRLHRVLAAYLEAVEAGPAPEQQQWLARHPEFAAELRDFFTAHGRVARFAAPLLGRELPLRRQDKDDSPPT